MIAVVYSNGFNVTQDNEVYLSVSCHFIDGNVVQNGFSDSFRMTDTDNVDTVNARIVQLIESETTRLNITIPRENMVIPEFRNGV